MHRRPGIGGLKRTVEAKKNFQNVGEQLEAVQMEHMSRSLAAFRTNLESFARAHKHEINANPAFRRQFQIMCTQVGVDPLASHKGFWSDLLGLGDFYYELSVQIIEICLLTRDTNGGIISVEEMVQRLRKKRGPRAQEISEDDIIQSLKRVSSLGGGYRLIRIGSRQMIASKPMELNTDHMSILEQAQGTGYCTIFSIRSSLGWTDTRCETVINWMLQEGMIWIDTQSDDGEIQYWFPSLFAQIQANQAGTGTT